MPVPTPFARVAPLALAATILAVASGCGKTTATAEAHARTESSPSGGAPFAAGDSTELSLHPNVLYQVFGERNDPRLLPVALLEHGAIRPIVLDAVGWQRFDSLYHRPGTKYTIYQNGREAGWARVTRPMWDERGEPLYTLPRCRTLTPLAAAQVKAPPPVGYLVEHLATDAPIAAPKPATRGGRVSADGAVSQARRVAAAVADAAGIDPATLAALDFRAVPVYTSPNGAPTLVISFMDPTAGGTGPGHASHLFILADRIDGEYRPTYMRIVRSTSVRTDYRRYVDHLDLTEDGVDELVLEGWSSGHESYMLILQFRDGKWSEVFQGRPSWCLDK